jgi:hypothetical protein
MGCKRPYTNIWVARTLGSGYWVTLRKAMMESVFQTERAWIPGDMSEVEIHKLYELIREASVKTDGVYKNLKDVRRAKTNARKALKGVRGKARKILIESINNEHDPLIEAAHEIFDNARKKYDNALRNYNAADPGRIRRDTNADNELEAKFKVHCAACPNGFIDPHGKCAVCSATTCTKCRLAKGDTHECKEEDLATVEQLKKDTKGCPGCGVPIHKTVGCSQMWCPKCNTVFDWNTAKIQLGGWIHNPEYIRAGRNREPARNIQDIRCGGYGWRDVSEIMNERCYSFARHVEHQRRFTLDHAATTNRGKRIEYIMGKCTEDQFRKTLGVVNGTIYYHRDVRTILQCCIENNNETALAYTNGQITKGVARSQMNGNLSMINELLQEAGKLHKRKAFRITDEYHLYFGKTLW